MVRNTNFEIRPGMRVRVFVDHPIFGRLDGVGVVTRYDRAGSWWVALDPHGCETSFYPHNIFPLETSETTLQRR
jgi:hypothetical protein